MSSLPVPDPVAAPPARHIAVIGAGPRGVGWLERFAQNLPQFAVGPLTVHLIDPFPVGGGRIWRYEQSPLLKLNSLAQDVTLFTDDSVQIDGPVAPGPSLVEWAAGVRSGEIDDVTVTDASLARELARLGPKSFPTRRLQSVYLDWFYRRTVAALGDRAQVVQHRAIAIDVQELPDGRQSVLLARHGGLSRALNVDLVVYALGHSGIRLSGEPARLADFASRHGLAYVPPSFTADANLDALEAGKPVIVRGLGLAAIDLLVLLAEGRGGRFETDVDGELHYVPSGREPRVFIGSRRGIPYRSKVSTELIAPRPAPVFFNAEVAQALAADARGLDFSEAVWPLIAKEMLHGYYAELFAGHPDRVRLPWDEFLERFTPLDPFGPELAALADEAVIDPGDRLDLTRLDRPLHDTEAESIDHLQEVIRDHIRDDLDRRGLPEHSATQGLFLALLQSVFALQSIVGEADWSIESRERDISGWWHPYFSYLASGPPGHRLEELLALSRAGVVTFLGGGVEVVADDEAGLFRARGANHGEEVTARALVDAWLPESRASASDDPALRRLIETGAGRERVYVQGERVFNSGALEVTPDAARVVRADGTVDRRRFAIGPYTSNPNAGAFARPGTNAVSFRENDRVARAVLTELAALGGPGGHGGPGGLGDGIAIRKALRREYDAVGELCLAAYQADYEISAAYAEQLRRTELRVDEFDVWVAEDVTTGELVGTTSILKPGRVREGRSTPDELYFRLLAVSPTARRRGIGAALTRFTFDVARERGHQSVSLNSGERMLPAHALYRALGFERVAERDVETAENHTVYTFTRSVLA